MLRAVIFDFDGVIIDSEILHFRAFNEVLSPFGVSITEQSYYEDYLGLTDCDCFKAVNSKYKLKLDDKGLENILKEKGRSFRKLVKTSGRLIEGVPDFLMMLKQNNIPMAICSGALLAEIVSILDANNLKSFFEVIVSADQVKRGKPYPDGFLLALRKLNDKRTPAIQPGQCIVIEDSRWGLEAAKAAGMHTIAVTNSYDAGQLKMADKIVTKLNELTMRDLQQLCS
jgi:beta-phosphoglucomutase